MQYHIAVAVPALMNAVYALYIGRQRATVHWRRVALTDLPTMKVQQPGANIPRFTHDAGVRHAKQ